jgi:hypothetical protein
VLIPIYRGRILRTLWKWHCMRFGVSVIAVVAKVAEDLVVYGFLRARVGK